MTTLALIIMYKGRLDAYPVRYKVAIYPFNIDHNAPCLHNHCLCVLSGH